MHFPKIFMGNVWRETQNQGRSSVGRNGKTNLEEIFNV